MSVILRFGILTVSDRSARGERPDLSGPALGNVIISQGWEVAKNDIVPDEIEDIRKTLIAWSDENELDVILSTGGTGFSPRDVTPEATLEVIERLAPGLSEVMRTASLEVTRHAMLSRATAGIRGSTLIVNLPGSPNGAVENFEVILLVLPHAVAVLRGDDKAERSH